MSWLMHWIEQNDIIGYYTHGLLYNDFVAASTNGAFVYNPQDTKAVEYVNEQINISKMKLLTHTLTKIRCN
jgi:hypothetical protein